jgi:hypothetical protein
LVERALEVGDAERAERVVRAALDDAELDLGARPEERAHLGGGVEATARSSHVKQCEM